MPGRKYTAGNGYRYGFNGKENDKDVKGDGNQYDYGFRIYNPRIGRFLSSDPLTQNYPWYTPYQFAGNKPLIAIDIDGLEEFYTINGNRIGNGIDRGKTELKIANEVSCEEKREGNIITVHRTVEVIASYKLNSDRTALGRNENTKWNGITKLDNLDLSLLNDFVSGFVVQIRQNIENAMLVEANAGYLSNPSKLLDFKHQTFKLLDIPYNNLIEIDGVLYNPNEAGNYVWGMVTEMAGAFLDPNLLGHVGSLADDLRLDEPWDQKAMTAGRAKAHSGDIKQTDKFDKVVDFYRSDYEDFVSDGGDKGRYKPSIDGMLKNIKEYKEHPDNTYEFRIE